MGGFFAFGSALVPEPFVTSVTYAHRRTLVPEPFVTSALNALVPEPFVTCALNALVPEPIYDKCHKCASTRAFASPGTSAPAA